MTSVSDPEAVQGHGTPSPPTETASRRRRVCCCCHAVKDAGLKLKIELLVAYVCLGDKDCGWGARVLVVLILCMALTPMDWAPEFALCLATTADFLLMPLLVRGILKLVPPQVVEKARLTVASDNFNLTMRRDWMLLVGVCVLFILNISGLAQVFCSLAAHFDAFENSYECTHEGLMFLWIAIFACTLCGAFVAWRLYVERPSQQQQQQEGKQEGQEGKQEGQEGQGSAVLPIAGEVGSGPVQGTEDCKVNIKSEGTGGGKELTGDPDDVELGETTRLLRLTN